MRGFGLRSQDAIPIVALVAGLGSGLSGQQPTGNSLADFLWTFLLGAALVWLSQFAPPRAVAISAVLGLFFTGMQLPAALMGAAAIVALLVVTAWVPFDLESRKIGIAVSAAFTSQAMLNLPNVRFVGSASLFAAIVSAPILLSGFANLSPVNRRRVTRTSIAAGILALVATALAVLAAVGVRDQVEVGIQQAEDGVTALEFGNQPQAVSLLDASRANFEIASNRLGGPLTWPARWVPVVAQHSRALETASDQGTALAKTAARTVDQADVEKIRGQNGAIDLEIVQAVNAELELANATLQQAQLSLTDVDTPWLLPVLSSRLDSVQEELAAAGADIDLANNATAVMPGILGAEGQRRYLVLFVQPAESREFGGFVGAYGILEVEQGRFELTESGSIDVDLGFGVQQAEFAEMGRYPEAYMQARPNINPQNLTATADLPTIAAAARELVPQWRLDPNFTIDGVISLDPYAMAGLLELSGPVELQGRQEPLNASNVVDFLLRDQYLEFEGVGRDVRQDALKGLAAETFAQLLSVEIPGPERLGSIFGPIARADRLSFITFDDAENAFLDRIFLSASLPEVGSAVDMVGIYGQTGTASKLDGYGSRSVAYDATVNPASGEVTGELTIIDRNDAPADADEFILGRPADGPLGDPLGRGSNFVALGVYTRSVLSSISVDTAFVADEPQAAFSYDRYPIRFEVPLGGSATVSMNSALQVEPGRYDIFIPAQASAIPSEFTLTVRPADGWVLSGVATADDGTWSQTFTLNEPQGLTFTFEPES